mmetsp:Transcript_4093/g.16768  ORF Transcript_4093/g.16768 Transcript_4093/m.16768 type:complete len:236 (+) Transcript_4093:808-1515(+)
MKLLTIDVAHLIGGSCFSPLTARTSAATFDISTNSPRSGRVSAAATTSLTSSRAPSLKASNSPPSRAALIRRPLPNRAPNSPIPYRSLSSSRHRRRRRAFSENTSLIRGPSTSERGEFFVRPLFSLLLSPSVAARGSVVGGSIPSPFDAYTPYRCSASRNGPSRKSGIGPFGPNRDMIRPSPYTASHRSAESGGASGTTTGPRTKRKLSHGMRTSASSASSFATSFATGGTKGAW